MSAGDIDIPYGAKILIEDNINITTGMKLATWSNIQPIIAEYEGELTLSNMSEKWHYIRNIDEVTGKKSITIIQSPQMNFAYIKHNNNLLSSYYLPENTTISLDFVQQDNALSCGHVSVGDIIGYTSFKLEAIDIVSGLQELIGILETRIPNIISTVSPYEGYIKLQQTDKNVLIISNDEGEHTVQLKNKQLIVQNGQYVRKGDLLTSGEPLLQDLIKYKPFNEFVLYCVGKLQDIYLHQGIDVNSKHIEVILSQMCKTFSVTHPNDSGLLIDDEIDLYTASKIDRRLLLSNKKTFDRFRVINSITKSSTTSKSFLSACSFQNTTKILSESAIRGKIDPLFGISENVIVGKLIHCGTGQMVNLISKNKI